MPLALTCPIDGLALAGTLTPSGDAQAKEEGNQVGKHLHYDSVTMQCLSGHQWILKETTMYRTA